jgi:hypothetical protein
MPGDRLASPKETTRVRTSFSGRHERELGSIDSFVNVPSRGPGFPIGLHTIRDSVYSNRRTNTRFGSLRTTSNPPAV